MKRISSHATIAVLIGLLFLIAMNGCRRIDIYSIAEPTMTQTIPVFTPLPSATATETVIWFPATSTPRPLNTPTPFPTRELIPELGQIIVKDGFADEEDWQTFRSDQGNAVLSNGELTLAMQNTAGAVESYGSLPWLENYYLTMQVTLPICSTPEDVYGVIFKAGDSENNVRIWFNCLGQTRVEARVKNKLQPLTDWESNGLVRPGAPQKYRLGILVQDDLIRAFVNDKLIVETKESTLSPGGFGVTVRSSGMAPITVSFSALRISLLR